MPKVRSRKESKKKTEHDKIVSVVILNYNGRRYLENCLTSLNKTTYRNYDVILVDNASQDDSVNFVKKNFPYVKVIENPGNLGFAKGYNVCLKKIKTEYVVLLGNDTTVDPKWLEELIRIADSDPQIGICGGKILMLDNPRIINSAGGECDISGFAPDRGIYEIDRGQYEKIEEVFHVCGADMCVRREILDDIGFFDPQFFMYAEDTDLCWRARICGYKVVYVPRSIIYHKFGGIGGKANPKRRYLSSRNMLRAILKNSGPRLLLGMLNRFIMMKIGEILLFLVSGRVRVSVALVNGMLWNIRHFPTTWLERKKVQLLRKVPDTEIQKLLTGRYIQLQLFSKGYLSMF